LQNENENFREIAKFMRDDLERFGERVKELYEGKVKIRSILEQEEELKRRK
jgi:hypothetical protein